MNTELKLRRLLAQCYYIETNMHAQMGMCRIHQERECLTSMVQNVQVVTRRTCEQIHRLVADRFFQYRFNSKNK